MVDIHDETAREAARDEARSRPLRLQAGAAPQSRRLQLVRRRIQLHLAVDRHLRALLPRPDDDRRRLLLELADRRAGPVHHRADFAELSSHYPVAGSVFQWTKYLSGQDVLVVRRLDLPVRRRSSPSPPCARRCRSRSSRRSTTWAGTSRATRSHNQRIVAIVTLVIDHRPEHLRREARGDGQQHRA